MRKLDQQIVYLRREVLALAAKIESLSSSDDAEYGAEIEVLRKELILKQNKLALHLRHRTRSKR